MTLCVDRNQVIEYEAHKFVVAASDLGLAPGEFPKQIETNLGNGQPLIRKSRVEINGDLIEVVYWQAFGCVELHVHND